MDGLENDIDLAEATRTPQRGIKADLGPSTPALNAISPKIKPRGFRRLRDAEGDYCDLQALS